MARVVEVVEAVGLKPLVMKMPGGLQQMTVVNEAGLYRLISAAAQN